MLEHTNMDETTLRTALAGLESRGQLIYDGSHLFIPDYARHQSAWKLNHFPKNVTGTLCKVFKKDNRAVREFMEFYCDLLSQNANDLSGLPTLQNQLKTTPQQHPSNTPATPQQHLLIDTDTVTVTIAGTGEGGVGETNRPALDEVAAILAGGPYPIGGDKPANDGQLHEQEFIMLVLPEYQLVIPQPRWTRSDEAFIKRIWMEFNTTRTLQAIRKFGEHKYKDPTLIEKNLRGQFDWDYKTKLAVNGFKPTLDISKPVTLGSKKPQPTEAQPSERRMSEGERKQLVRDSRRSRGGDPVSITSFLPGGEA
jgi:hypothetical protein